MFKARRITNHVDGVSRAIGRLNTLWNDPHDARPNELDVGFSEALEPAAIILQHTLAEGRVARKHLLDETRSALELGVHECE